VKVVPHTSTSISFANAAASKEGEEGREEGGDMAKMEVPLPDIITQVKPIESKESLIFLRRGIH